MHSLALRSPFWRVKGNVTYKCGDILYFSYRQQIPTTTVEIYGTDSMGDSGSGLTTQIFLARRIT